MVGLYFSLKVYEIFFPHCAPTGESSKRERNCRQRGWLTVSVVRAIFSGKSHDLR